MKPGQRVRRKGGTMVGTVIKVLPGSWSNGKVPMVKVQWTSPSNRSVISKHTATTLEKVQ